ncbi:MAG: 1,2-phenylacetyl-CoA epoxidase subunit PaaC [Chitinophagaceae bacterium]
MNEYQSALYRYLLRLGDNALIHGQRLSEWCSRGPTLEEDLALTNIALDEIGRAQALFEYAAEVEAQGRKADDLAFKRSEREYFNNLICELPRGDFAITVMKQALLSAFEVPLFEALQESRDERLSAIAHKAHKEVRYHWQHASDWCKRLALGTNESKRRLQEALNALWMYTGELFEMYDDDAILANQQTTPDLNDIRATWMQTIGELIKTCDLKVPNVDYMQTGSRNGVHTEHLGHMLSEMQYLQRAYPDARW